MSETFSTEYTDDEVVRHLQHGTETNKTLAFLYRNHYGLLRQYIVTNSGNDQDAEDIFQDVLVAFIALVKAQRFLGASSIRTFLYALTCNMWLNELKRRGRAGKREEKYEAANEETGMLADKAMELQQSRKSLMAAVEALGEACKKILLLYYFEDKSMKDITSHLPYENEQVVRNKKHKCLKKLQQLVAEDQALKGQLQTFLNDGR